MTRMGCTGPLGHTAFRPAYAAPRDSGIFGPSNVSESRGGLPLRGGARLPAGAAARLPITVRAKASRPGHGLAARPRRDITARSP